jgi:hypothetical protein
MTSPGRPARSGRRGPRAPGAHWAAPCAWLTALACVTATASADVPADAAAYFREGTAAFDRGDYRASALAFEAAHRRAPHPSALYNAARAWDAAGDRPRAADAFAGALRAGLHGAQRRDAEERGRALAPSLARLRVLAPAGSRVTVGHADRVETPADVHLEPGEHEVIVQLADGRRLVRRIEASAGDHTLAVGAPAPAPAPPRARAEAAVPAPVPAASTSGLRVAGLVGLGTSAVLTGAAVVLGVATLDARDRWDEDGHHDLDLRDEAVGLRTWTNVAWFSAAAIGAAGLVLVLAAPSSGPQGALRARGGPWIAARF